MPSSYVLQEEYIHVGETQYPEGGFADMSDGEYQGCAVAIKNLGMNGDGSGKFFKVFSANPANPLC